MGSWAKEPIMSNETLAPILFVVIISLGAALIFGIVRGLAKRAKKE
jgi:hypothetical protein